jgi:hypothetical protein
MTTRGKWVQAEMGTSAVLVADLGTRGKAAAEIWQLKGVLKI